MKRTGNRTSKGTRGTRQRGAALVTVLFILLLLMGFVALAVSRTSTETIMTNNDVADARAFAASEAALENATRDFADVFESRLIPTAADIAGVEQSAVPGFGEFDFVKNITMTKTAEPVVLTGGNYGGLYALRDAWEIEARATDRITDVKVSTRRRFFSDRIPVFQFGVFFEDDLELNRPPLFTLGGRVHTNGNFFVTAADGRGIYFDSKVTAAGEIVNDIWKTRQSLTTGYDDQGQVFVKDAAGVPQELKTGEASVICVSPSGPNVFAAEPKLPNCGRNTDWSTQKAKFQGNLESNVPPLTLPLTKLNTGLIEIIKRGRNVGDLANIGGSVAQVTAATQDGTTLARERFANKNGIRISLADSQGKLPGCAGVSPGSDCGVRLDGPLGSSIGYQPLTMTDGYRATALNAARMAISGRQIWIKIETVSFGVGDLAPQTRDITADLLSLGVTDPAPVGADLQISGYTSLTDTRSIVKLQRFAFRGPAVPPTGTTSYVSNYTLGGVSQNLVVRYRDVLSPPLNGCVPVPLVTSCTPVNVFSAPSPDARAGTDATAAKEDAAHLKWAGVNGGLPNLAIVPFPIKIFDSREGLPNDTLSEANTNFGTGYVPAAGAMSLVDIDVANLRRFLRGDFNGKFPTGTPFAAAKGSPLSSADVPEVAGWVLYVSDRRGDHDFDGAYDMEDVFPNGTLDYNEDVNGNGVLDVDLTNEGVGYTTSVPRGRAATADHAYYRRGVRLINGSVLPGNYDSADPNNTRGFTVASENGVYVRGNYNTTGAAVASGTDVTPPENYFPKDAPTHIPASIVADAVVILSNAWTDGNSFANPFESSKRVAADTQVRFAMISGDPVTGNTSISYAPSQYGQLNGGVHNFKRFLEIWTGKRLNYSGSLINLFNSQNNNGFQKCCTTVYKPPVRDWTFDNTFQNAGRLPPGTPYIYSISFTGFQRVND